MDKLIDVSAKNMNKVFRESTCCPDDIFKFSCIANMFPTVYAVEVVRCRDCKHSTLPSLITQRYGVPGTLTCHNHNSPCNKRNVKGECFCPYGERKDGDGDG